MNATFCQIVASPRSTGVTFSCTCSYETVVPLLLLRAILLRAGLGARIRDVRYGFHWNEDEEDRAAREGEAARLEAEVVALAQQLIEGTLEPVVPSLEEVSPLHREAVQLRSQPNRRHIASRNISDSLVVAAFRGVPNPAEGEQDAWFSIWERAVRETVEPLRQPDDEGSVEPEGHADAWDHYLLERVAAVLTEVSDPEAAQRLWQPIIELGTSAEDWVAWFARTWTLYVLHPTASPHIVASWLAMIDFALSSARWAGEGGVTYLAHKSGEMWRALLGFVHSSPGVWSDELRSRMQALKPRLATWAVDHLFNVDNVRMLAHMATQPASVDVTLPSLVWLHAASVAAPSRFWGRSDRGPDDSVLSALVHAWEHFRQPLRQDEAAFAAFRGLLEALLSRQYGPAFELADRVGTMHK